MSTAIAMAGEARGGDQTAEAAAKRPDALQPVDLRKVKVGGELGRRMEVTVTGNLLKIDVDKDFLAPFVGGAITLTLTEFPDPDGQWTYFRLADPKAAVEDELLAPGNK